MTASVFDDTRCELGEGPLWHPERGQLFWFDILEKRLLTREDGRTRHWQFDDHVSAAGWVDRDRLLIASERALLVFDLATSSSEPVCPLEADDAATRSNDGRADPWGGFWIGTMGKRAERHAGAIYRFHEGELRRLVAPITIPNAICFAPDRSAAYYADSPTRRLFRQRLDAEGWPVGEPALFHDFGPEGLVPDGAVTDADGNLWIAQWGAGQVACHAPDGRLLSTQAIPGRHSTCPAFGGPDLTTLYVTSALEHMAPGARDDPPENGMTFAIEEAGQGLPEPRVILS